MWLAESLKHKFNFRCCYLGEKKGIFAVADPDFENNDKVTLVIHHFRPKYTRKLIDKALIFWRSEIFPRS